MSVPDIKNPGLVHLELLKCEICLACMPAIITSN